MLLKTLNIKYVFHLVGIYYRTKVRTVCKCMYMCAHTRSYVVYSVPGERGFNFFASIAVSFDATIWLLTDKVIGLEWNYFLDLYQCEIRICP